MSRRMSLAGVCITAVALTLAAGCAKKKEVSETIADIQRREGVPVRVVAVSRATVLELERAGGTVEGVTQSELAAMVPGVLRSLPVKVGSKVAQGAVLATVDPDMASPVAMAKAQYDQLAKTRERVQALAKEGGVPQDAVDEIETGYTVAGEQLDAARKAVNIIAPFAGTVIEVMATVNSKVGPGQIIIKLADLRRARVVAEVNESLIEKYRVGQPAFVTFEQDTVWGKVEKVAIGAKDKGHVFPVDIVFNEPGTRLRPGTFVTVKVVVRELRGALALPDEIVGRGADGATVFAVEGDIVKKVTVTLDGSGEGLVSIAQGLAEGQLVVAQGANLLADGMKVKVVGQQ